MTCGVKHFDRLIIPVYRRRGRRGAVGIEEGINGPKKEGPLVHERRKNQVGQLRGERKRGRA